MKIIYNIDKFQNKQRKFLADPTFQRFFNGWATVIWFILIPVTVFTPLKDSIPWLALMSAWANFGSHLAAWVAAIGSEYSQK